jgi:TolB protein
LLLASRSRVTCRRERSPFQRPVLRTHQPARIALPDFVATSPSEVEQAKDVSQIIVSDLKLSGVFAPISPSAFAGKNAGIDEVPKFAESRATSAEELVVGRDSRQPGARIKIEFRLWEVSSGQPLIGRQYTGDPSDLTGIAHMISQDIHERITGAKRTFD